MRFSGDAAWARGMDGWWTQAQGTDSGRAWAWVMQTCEGGLLDGILPGRGRQREARRRPAGECKARTRKRGGRGGRGQDGRASRSTAMDRRGGDREGDDGGGRRQRQAPTRGARSLPPRVIAPRTCFSALSAASRMEDRLSARQTHRRRPTDGCSSARAGRNLIEAFEPFLQPALDLVHIRMFPLLHP